MADHRDYYCYEKTEKLASELALAITAYERQPDKNGWIKWTGDVCPVPFETLVDLSRPDGMQFGVVAGHYCWQHFGNAQDMTAYRIHNTARGRLEC